MKKETESCVYSIEFPFGMIKRVLQIDSEDHYITLRRCLMPQNHTFKMLQVVSLVTNVTVTHFKIMYPKAFSTFSELSSNHDSCFINYLDSSLYNRGW